MKIYVTIFILKHIYNKICHILYVYIYIYIYIYIYMLYMLPKMYVPNMYIYIYIYIYYFVYIYQTILENNSHFYTIYSLF